MITHDARGPTVAASRTDAQFVVEPLSAALGAEVLGADLSKSTPLMLESIREHFLNYHLLVFRDQEISDAHIQRFVECFGPLEINQVKATEGGVLKAVHSISNLNSEGRPSENPLLKTNYSWHSDKSYLPRPALMTTLYGLQIPPVGGDTQFANMEMAYDELSPELQARIAHLKVIQSFDFMLENLGRPPIIEEKDIPPPVQHPLVRRHPDTGRKSLFVGMYSAGIVGMPQPEALELIAQLLKHATQDRYVFTQKWRERDFVVWDNRSLIHRAIPNFEMGTYRRVLRRCVARGTVPQ